MKVKLSSQGLWARGPCGSQGGECQASAHQQLPAEDENNENLPPLHRHTPDLHLHPCNDTQMCTDIICLGHREQSQQKTIALLGGSITILVNPWPGARHRHDGSLTRWGWGRGTAGWEVNRLVKHIWLGESWAHCELLSQLRNTLQVPSAGESESPFHPGLTSTHTACTINYCSSSGNLNKTKQSRDAAGLNNSPAHRKLCHSGGFKFQGALVPDYWVHSLHPLFCFSFSSMLFMSLNRASFIIIIPNSGLLY